jgi:23S rRNA pseudoU1915 N3-methylase RlmH
MIIRSACLHQIRTRYYTRHQERKNLSESQQKKEGELILAKITPTDQLILLDERKKSL